MSIVRAELVVRGRWKLAYERAISSKYAQGRKLTKRSRLRVFGLILNLGSPTGANGVHPVGRAEAMVAPTI